MSDTQVGCPRCGHTELDAWYLDPVKYPVHSIYRDENGAIEFEYGDAQSEIGEGGELDDFHCPNCDLVGIEEKDLTPVGAEGFNAAAAAFNRARGDFGPYVTRELARIVREVIPQAKGLVFALTDYDDGEHLAIAAVVGGDTSEASPDILDGLNDKAASVLNDVVAVYGTNLDALELPE